MGTIQGFPTSQAGSTPGGGLWVATTRRRAQWDGHGFFSWLCKGVLMEHHLSMGIFYGVVLFGCLLMGMSMVITSVSWDMTPVTMVVHLGIEKHVDIGLGVDPGVNVETTRFLKRPWWLCPKMDTQFKWMIAIFRINMGLLVYTVDHFQIFKTSQCNNFQILWAKSLLPYSSHYIVNIRNTLPE